MPYKELFSRGELIITYRGSNAPVGEIYTIIECYKPIQVNSFKYYQAIKVQHTTTKKYYITYDRDIMHYEPLEEDTTIHTLIFDPSYEFEREEE